MASVVDLRRQIDIVDRQIVELLSRRTNVVKQVMNHLEDDEVDTDREQQVLANWLEEGFDYDLDEGALEKVCRAVMELGKKSKDR
jgi:chorismate mutase